MRENHVAIPSYHPYLIASHAYQYPFTAIVAFDDSASCVYFETFGGLHFVRDSLRGKANGE